MNRRWRFAYGIAAAALVSGRILGAQAPDRRQLERIEQTLREEGQAVVALADAVDRPAPADFTLAWHNDFLKAQNGTFVPFIVTIAPRAATAPAALLYVRVARPAPAAADPGPPRRTPAAADAVTLPPFEEIYPVTLADQPVRITRGFALPAGQYELTVVVREREREEQRGRRRLAAVLRQSLEVPDFTTSDLATSTIMLADRLTVLPDAPSSSSVFERPYVIGTREIQPAADAVLERSEELIVVLLVYNPTLTTDKQFDLEVEYHFFRKSRAGPDQLPPATPAGLTALPGEHYFNRTEPQRFNPALLGPAFDPASGQPVMAGQGVPLSGFPEGEYRLLIRITDQVSKRSLDRQVLFTVRS